MQMAGTCNDFGLAKKTSNRRGPRYESHRALKKHFTPAQLMKEEINEQFGRVAQNPNTLIESINSFCDVEYSKKLGVNVGEHKRMPEFMKSQEPANFYKSAKLTKYQQS